MNFKLSFATVPFSSVRCPRGRCSFDSASLLLDVSWTMSAPSKSRKLPSWAEHSTPVGGDVEKNEVKEENRENSRQNLEEDDESASSLKPDDFVPEAGAKPLTQEFGKLLSGVVFSVAGLVNPERSELREKALAMGGQFRPKWGYDSTLLVCPFQNTPTFKQVVASGGTVVHPDWIYNCYDKKSLVAIEEHLLHVGKPWRTVSLENDASDVAQEGRTNENHDTRIRGSKGVSAVSTKGFHHKSGPEKPTQTSVAPKNQPSPVDIQQWVLEDLAATLTWLEQQNDKPEEYELETVAAQGLLVCLEDATRCLQNNEGLSMVMDNWAFIPKAVKELAAYEKNGHSEKHQLIAEGERFKLIYEAQLQKLGFGIPSARDTEPRPSAARKHEDHAKAENLRQDLSGQTENDVDDDATEVISDADSRDPGDFDSDDTVELNEDEIMLYKEQILQTLRLS